MFGIYVVFSVFFFCLLFHFLHKAAPFISLFLFGDFSMHASPLISDENVISFSERLIDI